MICRKMPWQSSFQLKFRLKLQYRRNESEIQKSEKDRSEKVGISMPNFSSLAISSPKYPACNVNFDFPVLNSQKSDVLDHNSRMRTKSQNVREAISTAWTIILVMHKPPLYILSVLRQLQWNYPEEKVMSTKIRFSQNKFINYARIDLKIFL